MTEAGIDTARILYRLRSEPDIARAVDLFDRVHVADLGPLKMGYDRRYEMLWVEGRPVTIADPDSHALLPAGGLGEAQEGVKRRVREHFPSAREIGVSRLDTTATVDCGRPADGWAVMRALAGLPLPRREVTQRVDQKGRPMTLSLHYPGAARVLERVYDKGAEAGIAPAGTLIRFEAQRRSKSTDRTTAQEWTMERVRETHARSFAPTIAGTSGVRVAARAGVEDQIARLTAEGSITARQARAMLGHIACESVGIPVPNRTARWHRAEMRRVGLALALDGVDDAPDLDVDLAALLADVAASERWAA